MEKDSAMEWVEKKRLEKRYDQFTNGYTNLHGEEQLQKYRVVIESLQLGAGDLVADLGCGVGLFLEMISPRLGEVVGLNLSSKELQEAKSLSLSNVHLIQGDLDMPPFRDKVFTYIFSFTVLHHSQDAFGSILSLERLAKRGMIVGILKRTEVEKEVRAKVKDLEGVKVLDDRSTKDLLLFIGTPWDGSDR